MVCKLRACTKTNDPDHAERFSHGEEQADPPAFALDCEFIEVRQGKGDAFTTFKVTVSVGVVSEQLETILYARVKQPPRTQVPEQSSSPSSRQ